MFAAGIYVSTPSTMPILCMLISTVQKLLRMFVLKRHPMVSHWQWLHIAYHILAKGFLKQSSRTGQKCCCCQTYELDLGEMLKHADKRCLTWRDEILTKLNVLTSFLFGVSFWMCSCHL